MKYYTVKQVAEMWQAGRETVLSAIHSKRLRAFRLNPEKNRSPWRITDVALQEFDTLTKSPLPAEKRRVKSRLSPDVIKFF